MFDRATSVCYHQSVRQAVRQRINFYHRQLLANFENHFAHLYTCIVCRHTSAIYLTDYCVPAIQCPTLPVAGTCDPPAVPSTDCSTCPLQHLRLSLLRFCWSYRLQSGIHCLTVCAIQLLDQTSFDGLWKLTFLPIVSVSLTVRWRCFYVFALYKCTFTYLLTSRPFSVDAAYLDPPVPMTLWSKQTTTTTVRVDGLTSSHYLLSLHLPVLLLCCCFADVRPARRQ